ncbi:TPA: hypothetical protein ACLFK6_000288 [Serratia marcescens]|nr:hypothetical protein [Serratia marcescens]
MKVLSQYEEQYVSGGDLNAAWDGLLDGAMTGGVAGGVGLGLYGLTHTQQEVADYAKHFRETIGSTSTSVGGSL